MVMLNLSFVESQAIRQKDQDLIREIAHFVVNKYLHDHPESKVSDLDPITVEFVTPDRDPNAYGRAFDGANLDRITIRWDAMDEYGRLTDRGLQTVCHEFIHLAQYITDFPRRYDVPYRDRPQEAEAFNLAPTYAAAWMRAKSAGHPVKIPNDIPALGNQTEIPVVQSFEPEPIKPEKKKSKPLLIAAVVIVGIILAMG